MKDKLIVRESLKESAGWIAIWNGKKCEIGKDEAKDLWGAKQLAIKKLGVPKSKVGELAIDVGFDDNEEGTSNAQFESLKEEKECFFEIVFKEKGDEEEKTERYEDDFDGARADFLHMTQDERDNYQYVVLRKVCTDYNSEEEIEVIDSFGLEESLDEAKDIEVKDIEKMTELEPGDEVEVTKEMDDVFDTSLEMAKEFDEEPKLDTFDEQMDFLAKDEQEAIDGYEKVLALVEDEHVKEQLEKILVEERAHKEFLEKVKEDHSLEYSHEEHEDEIDDIEVIDEIPEEEIIDLDVEESLEEDTVKQGNKWVNKGDEGTHGKFKTKKEADAQRKAMFANGYHEELEDDIDDDFGYTPLNESDDEEVIDWDSLDDVEEAHVCERCGKEVCECDNIEEAHNNHTGFVKADKPIELKTRIKK